MQNTIDFVVMWVDGNDVAWREKKKKYLPKETADDSDSRYRDWETMRYWFRSVERYAPWVNKIHFVTDNQVPQWLNTAHPKLHLVSHQAFIPAEVLPLFNSSAIEIGIKDIPDLADQFVFFNDDIFLNAPINPEYYFVDGTPVDMAGMTRHDKGNTVFQRLVKNDYDLLNRHFDKWTTILHNVSKWYRLSYGKTLFRTILFGGGKKFHGLVIPHLSVPYRKNDMIRVWHEEPEILACAQKNRFRCESDVNHFVYRFWRMCVGDFYPRKSRGQYISLRDMKSIERIEKILRKGTITELCINDNWEGTDITKAKDRITLAFSKKFPQKSTFEK